MHNVLGNRAIEGKLNKFISILNIKSFFVLVLANHLLVAVEQNQSWQVMFY
jgi:hypothetical protein